MIVDVILMGLAFYLAIPFIAGYCAKSYGRSFWLWFILGAFLPVLTHFLLFALIFVDEYTTPKTALSKREEAEAEQLVKDLMAEIEKPSVKSSG